MNFNAKQQPTRRHSLLTWIIILTIWLNVTSALSPNYFLGTTFQGGECGAAAQANCDDTCPDNFCIGSNVKNSICLCHEVNENKVENSPCSFFKSTPKGGGGGAIDFSATDIDTICESILNVPFRSRSDAYICRSSSEDSCVVKDYLEEIRTEGPFGGTTVELVCVVPEEDLCQRLCPNAYTSCTKPPGRSEIGCYCHNNPPTESDGYTCTGPETVTPSDSPSTGTEPNDVCQNIVAEEFTEDVDVYTCSNSGGTTTCVFVDFPPPTTTEAPSIFGKVSCEICDSDSFLSFVFCPVLCIVFGVVKFVKLLLSGLLSKIGVILNAVPSILGELVDSIGGLLE